MRDEWDDEKKRQALEKHEELFWSEIEDGIASSMPRFIPIGEPMEDSEEREAFWEKLKKDVDEIAERWKLK